MDADDRLALSHVVPIRVDAPDHELLDHLTRLADDVDDIVVVDGSEPHVFALHDSALPDRVHHLRPTVHTAMGEVGGVLTGLQVARHDLVVLADDDVRWNRDLLERAIERMGDADVARPQNAFDPAPWHARWDTGRILVNRAVGGDWPGTMLVRAAALPHGYAGDVLFENLELVRTVEASGARSTVLLDVVVPRRPPATNRFWEQRVRQAYDEMARPWRLLAQLSLLPVVVRGRGRALAAVAGGAVALAEVGRRRAHGRSHWPASASLWAVPWAAERAVTSWLALLQRCRGGVPYRGTRLRRAAHRRQAIASRRPPSSS